MGVIDKKLENFTTLVVESSKWMRWVKYEMAEIGSRAGIKAIRH